MTIFQLRLEKQLNLSSSFSCLQCLFDSIHSFGTDGGAILMVLDDYSVFLNQTMFSQCSVSDKHAGGAVDVEYSTLCSRSCCFVKCWAYDQGCGITHNGVTLYRNTEYSFVENCLFHLGGDETINQDGAFYCIAQVVTSIGINSTDNAGKYASSGCARSYSTTSPTVLKMAQIVRGRHEAYTNNYGQLVASHVNFIECEPVMIKVAGFAGTHHLSHMSFDRACTLAALSAYVTFQLMFVELRIE